MNAVPIPRRTKLFFGLGATAESVFLYTFGFLAMLYYNQVLGLPATLAGLGPTLALVFDAVTDPLIGSWSDRFRSKKWGRRHPFMLAAPIPVTLSFLAIFNPPEGLSQTELFIWLILFSILMRSCMTLYFVPHLALGGEMSRDYHERSSIMSYNNLGGYIGAAGAHWLSLTFIFIATAEYANGLLNPDAYPRFSWWAASIVFISLYLCAWGTRDRIPHLAQPTDDQPGFSLPNLYSDLAAVLKNRNYLFLLLGLLLVSITVGMRAAFNQYMNIFYWELLPSEIRWFVLGSATGYIAGFFFAYKLHRRFDKRATMLVAVTCYAFFDAMPVILRILGFFPENGTDALFPSILVFHAFGAAAISILNITVMSALADVADENELRHGMRQEGILYSARSFFSKADRALGTFLAGVTLDLIMFPANAKPGEVEADVVFMLGVMDSPVTIVPALIAAMFYAGYRLNKVSHAELRAKLDARASQSESNA
ncbi:MAG: MFS transporter [Pseudomonadales bacterium]|nr:MFS transporter [Pseudomonadales bacterium]